MGIETILRNLTPVFRDSFGCSLRIRDAQRTSCGSSARLDWICGGGHGGGIRMEPPDSCNGASVRHGPLGFSPSGGRLLARCLVLDDSGSHNSPFASKQR